MRITLCFVAALMIAGCSDKSDQAKPALHPGFPVAEGRYPLTQAWEVTLPGKFNRRLEDGSLVIWRPGFTIWANDWNNDQNETLDQILDRIQAVSSPDAYDTKVEKEEGLIRYSYRLEEGSEDGRQPAFYCFAIGNTGHVQMAIYFDDADDFALAEQIWHSLSEKVR